MATLEKCDGGCGKVSPDFSAGNKGGPHISNHWIEITVKHRGRSWFRRDTGNVLLVCQECFEKTGVAKLEGDA